MNTVTEPVSTTRPAKRPIWRWVLLGFIALIAIGVVLNATHRPPPVPPVVLLPPGYKIPPQKGPVPDRWIPRSWGWLWRMKQRVFGSPKTIALSTSIIEFTALPQEVLSSFAIGEPTFTNSSGVRVWITDAVLMVALHERLGISSRQNFRVIATPRITTADGMHASLSMSTSVPINGTPTSIGVFVDVLPHMRNDSTDLTAILTTTEAVTNSPSVESSAQSFGEISVQTNLSVAARIQIPRFKGVLILDGGTLAEGGKIHGLIISADAISANSPQQNAVLRHTITRAVTPPAPRP